MPRKIPYLVNWQLMDETGLVSAREVTRDHAYAHVRRYFSINGGAGAGRNKAASNNGGTGATTAGSMPDDGPLNRDGSNDIIPRLSASPIAIGYLEIR